MSSNRWGEIVISTTDPGIAAIERNLLIKPKPLILSGPLLCRKKTEDISKEQPDVKPKAIMDDSSAVIDPIILHSIRLLQHMFHLKSLVKSDKTLSKKVTELPAFPECHECNIRTIKHMKDTTVLRKHSRVIPIQLPDITSNQAHELLSKSVAASAAHIGYTDSDSRLLSSLTSIADDFMTRFTRLLRRTVDAQFEKNFTTSFSSTFTSTTNNYSQIASSIAPVRSASALGFSDAMERVLCQCGISGSAGSPLDSGLWALSEFHHHRVTAYHDRLLYQARDLHQQLLSVLLSNSSSMSKQECNDINSDQKQSDTGSFLVNNSDDINESTATLLTADGILSSRSPNNSDDLMTMVSPGGQRKRVASRTSLDVPSSKRKHVVSFHTSSTSSNVNSNSSNIVCSKMDCDEV